MLDLVDKTLHQITLFVPMLVIFALVFTIYSRWNDHFHAQSDQLLDKGFPAPTRSSARLSGQRHHQATPRANRVWRMADGRFLSKLPVTTSAISNQSVSQSASAQVLTNLLWKQSQHQAGSPPNKASRLTLARILGRFAFWLRFIHWTTAPAHLKPALGALLRVGQITKPTPVIPNNIN